MKELGWASAAMPAYLNLRTRPSWIGRGGTRLAEEHLDADGEFTGEEPTGTLVDFIEGLRRAGTSSTTLAT
jgi:hypothetical protein